jgi:glutamyl-tRNA reductase
MERIACAGISLHETDVEGLGRLVRPAPAEEGLFLGRLADGLAASETVLIATCNRVEVVFAREEGHLPCRADLDLVAGELGLAADDPLRASLHFHTGRDAARHLFRIACSLDSLVVGEDQILAQVREAFARSEALALAGRLLGPLFECAFQLGKQVRTETELSRHPVSVVSIGVAWLAERWRSGSDGRAPRVAVVGAGRMGALVARSLREARIGEALFVNRSLAAAQSLAGEHGGRAVALEEFRSAEHAVDAIVSCTAAPGFVLDADTLRALARRTPSGRPLLAVDLALPRDLEPIADPAIERIDLDALRGIAERNRALRSAAAAEAEALVERKLEGYARRASEKTLARALAELSEESSEVLERELSQLFSGRLARLGDEDRRAVERWARAAFGRLSHLPISALKRLARQLAAAPGEGEPAA